MKVRITARICSWIVRRAMLDPRCQEFVIDEVLDSSQFDDAVRDSAERVVEDALRDHRDEYEHPSERDIDDQIENGVQEYLNRDNVVDPDSIVDFDGEVETIVKRVMANLKETV